MQLQGTRQTPERFNLDYNNMFSMSGSATPSNRPRVFISYSHDSDEHKSCVLGFARRLRADGINVVLDQDELFPKEGWPRWTEKQLEQSDFVLTVCTEAYRRRIEGREEAGHGLGVRWEGNLVLPTPL